MCICVCTCLWLYLKFLQVPKIGPSSFHPSLNAKNCQTLHFAGDTHTSTYANLDKLDLYRDLNPMTSQWAEVPNAEDCDKSCSSRSRRKLMITYRVEAKSWWFGWGKTRAGLWFLYGELVWSHCNFWLGQFHHITFFSFIAWTVVLSDVFLTKPPWLGCFSRRSKFVQKDVRKPLVCLKITGPTWPHGLWKSSHLLC